MTRLSTTSLSVGTLPGGDLGDPSDPVFYPPGAIQLGNGDDVVSFSIEDEAVFVGGAMCMISSIRHLFFVNRWICQPCLPIASNSRILSDPLKLE